MAKKKQTPMEKQTRKFIDALYGDLPEGHLLLVWTLPDKASHWFASAGEAADWIVENSTGKDVYCGVGLAAEDLGPNRRAGRAEVSAVVGAVADIDFAEPGKPGGPPDEEAALAVIEATGAKPTVVVNSGGGLQAWWLFKEPYVIDSEEDREYIAGILKDWHETVKEHARRLGYTVDSVWDLARIMRVPGTFNHKRDDSRPVTTRPFGAEARGDPDNLADRFIDPAPDAGRPAAAPGAAPTRADWPDVNLRAPFPEAKHEAMMANVAAYRQSWEHDRKDMRGASSSQYDQSLANLCVAAGWEVDEIVAVMVRHQQKWGTQQAKLNRPDYYQRTIHTARQAFGEDEAHDRVAAIVAGDEATRQERLDAIARRLDVPISNIQVITGINSSYRFWVDGRCCEIAAKEVVQQTRFMGEMFDLTRVHPRPFGRAERPSWRDFVNLIGAVAEEMSVGDEGSLDGELGALIRAYRHERGENTYERGEVVKYPNVPFTRDGRVWIRVHDVLRHARAAEVPMTRRELLKRLRALGAESKTHSIESGKRKSTATFWGIPDERKEGGEDGE
jgi:putative DNA primase/helicase